ncbi:MAG: site-2 protease family protein [Candidatus Taylorbacteria bacterium]
MTAIIFIIVLAVLIFVHELGHFLLARWNGIRVDAFKIGFGPRIFHWKRGETEYGINLIPFGGYVKIHGENPSDEATSGPDKDRSFINKNRWIQASVLLAGIFFNFIFAWLLYFGILFIGGNVPVSAFTNYKEYMTDHRVIVLDSTFDSPAIKAGLGIGDVISSVLSNGQLIAIRSTSDLQNVVNNSNGNSISLTYKKSGIDKTVQIVPVKGLIENKYAIGVSMDEIAYIHMPLFTALKNSIVSSVDIIWGTAVGLFNFVTGLFHGASSLSDVTGPIGIAVIIGNAFHLNISYLLIVVAIISINLGVINLVPFPALDGGRTLFVAIEGIIRRKIPEKFFNITNMVGFVLLMLLMVVVTFRDVVGLIK